LLGGCILLLLLLLLTLQPPLEVRGNEGCWELPPGTDQPLHAHQAVHFQAMGKHNGDDEGGLKVGGGGSSSHSSCIPTALGCRGGVGGGE